MQDAYKIEFGVATWSTFKTTKGWEVYLDHRHVNQKGLDNQATVTISVEIICESWTLSKPQ